MQKHWLARPRTIRRLWILGLIILGFTVLGEYLVERHPLFSLDRLPGFNAIFGFLACVGLILVAKLIALALMRADTYYGDGPDE
jgi:hypothetical protein